MSHFLSEDDLYRTSTQFRLWSFAPETLASLRAATHNAAIERARSYLPPDEGQAQETDLLTIEEEARLVQRYCEQIRTTSDHFKWPVNVKATAVQYLKRFYLSNSVLTYPPKELYKSVLFLASKTEGTHMTLSEYARRISTSPEQILAPEYKIIQALRFTLDVRQPFRGLKGCLMELLNLAQGDLSPLPYLTSKGTSATDLATQMSSLPSPTKPAQSPWLPPPAGSQTPSSTADRAHAAYATARHILDAPALLTDVYFLYTPPQIYLAALRLADPPLTTFYLETKLDPADGNTARVLATIVACATMLASFSSSTVMSKDERAALEVRLERCRDPGTVDMVGVNAAAKRGGKLDGALDEGVAARRRLERETSAREGEDLFGPSLGTAK